MANVVQISDYQRKARKDDSPATGATIHLFLGVRYERHIEVEQPVSPNRGGTRKTRKRA